MGYRACVRAARPLVCADSFVRCACAVRGLLRLAAAVGLLGCQGAELDFTQPGTRHVVNANLLGGALRTCLHKSIPV